MVTNKGRCQSLSRLPMKKFCTFKMEDSFTDLDRIVLRGMHRMGGLLVSRKELKVVAVHVSAPVPHDLVNALKVGFILLSAVNYLGLNFIPCCMANLSCAPFKIWVNMQSTSSGHGLSENMLESMLCIFTRLAKGIPRFC